MVWTLTIRRVSYEETNAVDFAVATGPSPTIDRDRVVYVHLVENFLAHSVPASRYSVIQILSLEMRSDKVSDK